MNVIFNPVYWFADKEKRFEMLADQWLTNHIKISLMSEK